jgi:hypothetical protein
MQWTSKSSPRPRKFVCKSPRLKSCWSHFFDKQPVIHKEFVPERQSVNSAFYVEVIDRLLKRIPWVRPQFRAVGSWFLLHYNAHSHVALVVKISVAKHSVMEISHPPILLISHQRTIFSFLRWKLPTKGRCFRMLKTLRKRDGRTERYSFGGLCWLFSRTL